MTMKSQSFLQGLGYPIEKAEAGDEALYGVVWLAARAQRRVAKVLKGFGLTPVKFNILMVVKHVGRAQGLSQREMGSRLLMDAGNMARVLDDLERRGWLIRAAGTDRRSHRIKITPKGSHLLDNVWPAYKTAVKELTGNLSEPNQHRLVGALSQWRDALQEQGVV